MNDDIKTLRELAKRYLETCNTPDQERKRKQWRRKNNLERVPPLVVVRAYAWGELEESRCVCVDPFFRQHEDFFRRMLFCKTLRDDRIFEPWVSVPAAHVIPSGGPWGFTVAKHGGHSGGSYVWDAPIRELSDIDKLAEIHHRIDDGQTQERYNRLRDAIGDIITVNLDRGPAYRMWHADISTDLALLRGMEQMMMDMIMHPKWLHELLGRMRDGILRVHQEAEDAGDWGMSNHENQSMPYAAELADPAANSDSVMRSQLWNFTAAQEYTGVSPAMHDEFLLQYQLPIMEKFGLVAYGCCEDLTQKIDMLRQIPNLRRIAVSPFADVKKCAEQIGMDYVISYRPSPADMVSYAFDEDRARSILTRDLGHCKSQNVDITLKDVETVEGDASRLRNWVRVTREIIDELWSQ